MAYEIFLLVSAAIIVLLDTVFLVTSKSGSKRKKINVFVAMTLAFGMIIMAYALLLQAFVRNDFQIIGVYSYSSSGTSIFSRIFASWAGAGGSMLFLTVILSIVYFALRIQALRKADKFSVNTAKVFGFILLVFIIVCMLRNPFETFQGIPIEGRGLNPQLQSLWMAIHPPIVFSAYAFVVLAYALTLACVIEGKDLDSSKLLKTSTYMAWLLLTLGIALGGVWAYEVLGWGGYWAWDPVETASLLPWLLLTAYFIMKGISKSKFSLTREFMIMIAFASLVFLSALTRGGFTQSVHSYAVSAVGPIMLSFAVVMITYFFYLKKKKRLPLFKLNVDKTSLNSRSSFLGFWALIFIAVVCLVGLAFSNFNYNFWTLPFVLIFVISLIGSNIDPKTHYVRLLLIALSALVVGGALSIVGFFETNILTTLSIPLLALGFSAIVYRLFTSIRRKAVKLIGQSLLSIAIIVLLLGVFISAGAKNTVTLNMTANTQMETAQQTIKLFNLRISNNSEKIYNDQAAGVIPEYSTIKADVTIVQSERAYEGVIEGSFYPNYGLVLRPLIITTAAGDIYVHLEYSDSLYDALVQAYEGNSKVPEEVSVTIQNNPMIYLVWGGVILMLFGIIVQFLGDLRSPKQES